jgi:hypothetical protein
LMNIVKVKLLRFVDKSKVEGFNKMWRLTMGELEAKFLLK